MHFCKTTLILVLLTWTSSRCKGAPQDGGSKCPSTTCTPAPLGTTCQATYDRDDGCCPVWHCANGQSVYGKASSNGFSSSTSTFSFNTNGGGLPGFPAQLPGFPGFGGGGGGGFPFFGR